jgi:hypothetical protein
MPINSHKHQTQKNPMTKKPLKHQTQKNQIPQEFKVKYSFKPMFKNICIFLSLFLAILTSNNANANMFNKFKKGFYFEKYKTADEAKEELLKLHPIGSDAQALIETIERAGGEFIIRITRDDAMNDSAKEKYFFKYTKELVEPNYYRYNSQKVDSATFYFTSFKANTGILNPLLWNILVWHDKENNITEIDLSKNYMGL